MSRELPVIQRPIDNTALAMFMTCPQKYDYAMNQHRRRTSDRRAPALAYGTAWHKMLETHYKTNGDQDQVYIALLTSWEDHGKHDDIRTQDRCWAEYLNYIEKWGNPLDEEAQTVGHGTETALVEISANVTWDGALHPYAGKIDRIIELNGQYYVEDHKTTTRMGDYYFVQFELKNQMMGYHHMARLLIPEITIAGVRINAHCVRKKDSEFRRKILSFAPALLDDWAENYNEWILDIERCHERGVFRRNFDACDGKYRQCEYADVCGMLPELRQRLLESEYEVAPWNPLEADELDESEV